MQFSPFLIVETIFVICALEMVFKLQQWINFFTAVLTVIKVSQIINILIVSQLSLEISFLYIHALLLLTKDDPG
jgi:hypothetical protein